MGRVRKSEVLFAERLHRLIPQLTPTTFTDVRKGQTFQMGLRDYVAWLKIYMAEKLLVFNYKDEEDRVAMQELMKPLNQLQREGWTLQAIRWWEA